MIHLDIDAETARLSAFIIEAMDELGEYDNIHELLEYEELFYSDSGLCETEMSALQSQFIARFDTDSDGELEALVGFLAALEDELVPMRIEEETALAAINRGEKVFVPA